MNARRGTSVQTRSSRRAALRDGLRRGARAALTTIVVAGVLVAALGQPAAPAARHRGSPIRRLADARPAVYVSSRAGGGYVDLAWVTSQTGTLTPVDVADRTPGPPITIDDGDSDGGDTLIASELSPDGRFLFVNDRTTSQELVIDADNGAVLGPIAGFVAETTGNLVLFSPSTDVAYLYSVQCGCNSLEVVDLSDPTNARSTATTLTLTGASGLEINNLAVTPDGSELVISTSNGLYTASAATGAVTGGPYTYVSGTNTFNVFGPVSIDPTDDVLAVPAEDHAGDGVLLQYSVPALVGTSPAPLAAASIPIYFSPLATEVSSDPANGEVVVAYAEGGIDDLYIVPGGSAGTTSTMVNVGTPLEAAATISDDGAFIAVPDETGKLYVISTASDAVLGSVPVGTDPVYAGFLALDEPLGGLLANFATWGGENSTTQNDCGCANASNVGNPINVEDGDFYESATDVSLSSDGPPLALTRTYDAESAQAELGSSTPGPFGYGWTDNYAMQLLVGTPASGDVTAVTETGARTVFTAVGSGCSYPFSLHGDFCALPYVDGALTDSGSSYTLTEAHGTRADFTVSGSVGQLESVTDPLGRTVDLAYGGESPGSGECPSSAASCETVSSMDGATAERTLTLGWSASGETGDVTSVTDPAGNTTTYGYCSSSSSGHGSTCATGDLITVTNPLGGITRYYYDTTGPTSPVDMTEDVVAVQPPTTSGSLTASQIASFCGEPVSAEAPAGFEVTCFDASGRAVAQADPDGGVTLVAYTAMDESDGDGTVAVSTPDGQTTEYDYVSGALVHKSVANLGSGDALSFGGSSWSGATAVDPGSGFSAVSCASTSFCAAVDQTGEVATYNGTAWAAPVRVDANQQLNGISCPSTSFCAAVDQAGDVVTSTDPTGGAADWTVADVDASNALDAVSCASSSFCAAVDAEGNALTSTVPTGGASDWTTSDADGAEPLQGLSCPSSSFCAAVDSVGEVTTFGGSTWSAPSDIDGTTSIGAVSCSSSSFCVAVDAAGHALEYTGSSWASTDVDGSATLEAVSCSSSTFCVAVDTAGQEVTYTGSWAAASDVDGSDMLSGVACVSSTFCQAVDAATGTPSETGYAHDPASLGVTEQGDPNGTESLATFDAASGNEVATKDSLGDATEAAYTAANQQWCFVAAAEYADGVRCPSSDPTSPPSADGATITVYNSAGEPTSVTDPLGNTTHYRYTSGVSGLPDGLLFCTVSAVEYAGGTRCPVYNTTASGATTSTLNASGDVLTTTDPDGNETQYTYYGNGQLHTALDANGTTTTDNYTNGLLTSQVVTSGGTGGYSATTDLAYDAAGRRFCTVDPFEVALGKSCPSSPPSSPPTPSSDPYLGATITTYDAAGRVVQVTNPIGGITYTAYDQYGRVFCTVSAYESANPRDVTCLSAPPSSPPTLSYDPKPGATITTYDAEGRVAQVTNPLGGITLYSYNGGATAVASSTAESGASGDPNVETAYTYDSDGRLATTTLGSGSSTATTAQSYDPDGNVFCSVSANAEAAGTAAFQCPAWQASWAASPPSPASLYSTSPSSSQANNVTTAFYDSNGNELQTTDPNVHTTVSAYDGDGREYCTADPTNVTAYLAAHSGATYPYLCPTTPPTTAPTSATGYVTTIYDPAGRTTSTTDQVADTTNYAYAPGGQVLTTTDPRGKVTTDCYYYEDGTGQCAHSATQADGSFDDLYSTVTPATSADPSGETTTDTYFAGGLADTTTTPAGTTTDGYDALGDLTSVGYSGAASGYAAPANVTSTYNPDGSIATTTDGTGTTTDSYDAAGDVLSRALSPATDSGLSATTLSYTYFKTGVLDTMTYPAYGSYSGPAVTYSYDALGRMASVTDWAGNEVAFSNDGDGNLTGQDNAVSGPHPSGTSSTAFSYDSADQLSSAATTQSCSGSGTLTQSFSGTTGSRNADGQVTQDEESYGGGCSGGTYERNYSYDEAGRVVYQGSVAQGSNPANFSYDASGDPTEISSHDPSASFDTYSQTFDSAGEVTGQSPVSGSGGSSSSYTYDSLGDLVSATTGSATTNYSYDQTGRMTALATGPVSGATDAYSAGGLESSVSGWAPRQNVDGTHTIFSISCPATSFCAAGDDAGNVLTWNGTSWSTSHVDSTHTLEGMSCPTSSFCAAVDNAGNVLTYNGTSWTVHTGFDGTTAMWSVSCSNASDCTAVDNSGNVVYTTNGWSTSPTKKSEDTHMFDRVSCPSALVCAAVDNDGRVVSTWNDWALSSVTTTDIDGTTHIGSISCPAISFCAAVDNSGNAITGNPITPSWGSATSVDGSNLIESVTCTSASNCIAADVNGNVVAFNGTSWSPPLAVDSTTLRGPSCASASFCVAVDHQGNVVGFDGASFTELTWSSVIASLPSVVTDGTWDYIYGPSGEPVEQMNVTSSPPANNPQFLTYTPDDSSWLLSSSSGTQLAFSRYDAFGSLALSAPGSAFGYAGQYAGSSVNANSLADMRARWYSPQTGGFTSRDPAFASTDQAYEYASGDPVNGGDPTGEATVGGTSGALCVQFWYFSYDYACAGAGGAYGGLNYENCTQGLAVEFPGSSPALNAADCQGLWQPAHLGGLQVLEALVPPVAGAIGAYDGYSAEAKAVENGCGFWQSVGIGITQGALPLVATGLGTLGGAADGLGIGPGSGAGGSLLDSGDLSGGVLANYGRFLSRLPAGAEPPIIRILPNGDLLFSAKVPASNIPGSFATYNKLVDASGTTINYWKTTVATNGATISVKVKF